MTDLKFLKLGVIGSGYVGRAIIRAFTDYCEVRSYDTKPELSGDTLEDVCKSDLVFVCLPTPMDATNNGAADISIIEKVMGHIAEKGYVHPIYMIKSTVPIGTTERLAQTTGLRIIHSPEFLTAKASYVDFITPSRIILGGHSAWVDWAVTVFEKRFPGANILTMSSDESEAVKYICNCFLAMKVVFFGEMRQSLEPLGLDWDTVINGVMTDGRIGNSHFTVPSSDGKYGVSGACFPKDLNAFIQQIVSTGFDPKILKAVWEANIEARPELNWRRPHGNKTG